MRRLISACGFLCLIPAAMLAQAPAIYGPRPAMVRIAPRAGPGNSSMRLAVPPAASLQRTHWKTGMVTGAVLLGLGGAALGSGLCHGLSEEHPPRCGSATLGMGLLGALVGGVVGGLIGGAITAE